MTRQLPARAWRAGVAVADDEAVRGLSQVHGNGEFGALPCGQLDLADDTRPADASMQAKAVEDATGQIILSIACFPANRRQRGAQVN